MKSVELSSIASKKSKFVQTFSKVLKVKSLEKFNDDKWQEEEDSLGVEALVATLFAGVASAKAAYARLQCAQCPYDVDGIQEADRLVVSQLKKLSELKCRFVKRQFDPSPRTSLLLAEVEEQKSIAKTYQIMGRKLESQLRLKDSEIIYLKEKLEESTRQNRSLEKRLNHSSSLSFSHFVSVFQFTVISIQSFVKMLTSEMKVAGWDLDTASNSIVPNVAYWRPEDKCFAFESFVCREMFEAFHIPCFGLSKVSLKDKNNLQQLFYKRFTELKSVKAKDYMSQHRKSTFAKFCKAKYLQLIHPRMEASFFGNLETRTTLVNSGEIPDSCRFFTSFAEMAKWVWVLHCLAFSFEPEVSIFQVRKGCRFSEVYMESVTEEALASGVAFTVFPGFRIGKSIIQCKVYLGENETKLNL